MRRQSIYHFPEARLDPGDGGSVEMSPKGRFRCSKLAMVGLMEPIRGSFKILRSRLPPLDRDNVLAYSNVTKRCHARRRTTVEFLHPTTGLLVRRQYRPESVRYCHVDPISYVHLDNIWVGHQNMFPNAGGGAPASFFSPDSFGNGIPMPTAESSIRLSLWNRGDVQVRVLAMMFGVEDA